MKFFQTQRVRFKHHRQCVGLLFKNPHFSKKKSKIELWGWWDVRLFLGSSSFEWGSSKDEFWSNELPFFIYFLKNITKFFPINKLQKLTWTFCHSCVNQTCLDFVELTPEYFLFFFKPLYFCVFLHFRLLQKTRFCFFLKIKVLGIFLGNPKK